MDEIVEYMGLLIQAIKNSTEYRTYQQVRAMLEEDPQLKERVDAFNAANFRLHTQQDSQQDSQQLFQEIHALEEESKALRRIPQVNAYLQAELDLCRLLQYVSLEINGQMDIHVPDAALTDVR